MCWRIFRTTRCDSDEEDAIYDNKTDPKSSKIDTNGDGGVVSISCADFVGADFGGSLV